MSLRTRLLAAMALVAVVLVAVAAVITVTTHDHLLRQVDDRLMALGAVGSPPLPDIGRGRPAADTNDRHETPTRTPPTEHRRQEHHGTNTTGEAGRGEPTPPAECPHWYQAAAGSATSTRGHLRRRAPRPGTPERHRCRPALDADQLAVRGARRSAAGHRKSANGTTTYRTLIVDRRGRELGACQAARRRQRDGQTARDVAGRRHYRDHRTAPGSPRGGCSASASGRSSR